MADRAVRVDDAGLHFADGFQGAADVYFDGHCAWSFSAEARHRVAGDPSAVFVPWPALMTRWLDGLAHVRVVSGEQELFAGDLSFGSGRGRVEFLDRHGIPVMIDKWGLLQRPFSARDSRVIEQMVEVTQTILQVMREECGVEGWIAFGTLLGAAREGAVIGHDSDIDLAYLSGQATPAEMTQELFAIARALRRHGMRVLHKSGAFLTVVFASSDQAMASIDIYTCFHLGDLLYETATVRAPVPRDAILPLGQLSFEGVLLPAPADPDALLTASYGPGWRVPDPSFRHEPGPAIVTRFDGWFSSLMRHRRDWERYLADQAQDPDHGPSSFAAWVAEQVAPGTRVVEVGSGTGTDALYLARQGCTVLGLDYARQSLRAARRAARREQVTATFAPLNLYDRRDVLVRGAQLAHEQQADDDRTPTAVYARGVLEVLDPDGCESFWRLVAMALRAGGTAYLSGVTYSPADAAGWRTAHGGGRRNSVDPDLLTAALERAGGRVIRHEGLAAARAAAAGAAPAGWRMVAEWPARPVGRAAREEAVR